MFNQTPFFRYNNPYNRFNNYNPAFFTPNNYPKNNNNVQQNKEDLEKKEELEKVNVESKNNLDSENVNEYSETKQVNPVAHNQQDTKKDNHNFRFGPIDINKEKLSIFGFNIEIDDLLLIGIIFILLLDSDCDYALIIVLGLMLFNINFSNLNIFKFF